MSERLFSAAIVLMLALVAAPAAAVAVPDPTRPAVMPATPRAEGEPVSALVLQSTLVSPRQRSAIINGQRYRLGESVGEARLEAIGAGWVRLRGPTGTTELRLSYPVSTRPVNR